MRGQNRHLMTACQPIHSAFTVSAGDVLRVGVRSGARCPDPNTRPEAASFEKAFLSSWAFSLLAPTGHRPIPHAHDTAPNGNQRKDRVQPEFVGSTRWRSPCIAVLKLKRCAEGAASSCGDRLLGRPVSPITPSRKARFIAAITAAGFARAAATSAPASSWKEPCRGADQ